MSAVIPLLMIEIFLIFPYSEIEKSFPLVFKWGKEAG